MLERCIFLHIKTIFDVISTAEKIQADDKILSKNPETGKVAYKTVEERYDLMRKLHRSNAIRLLC